MTNAPVFLTADWADLAMLNYRVEQRALDDLVPAGTELDTWNGDTFISLVGFRFLQTRVRGLRIPGHSNFDEVNLRFYVRRKASDGWRRGVVFVKEIVPRRAIAWMARTLYNENYVALPMGHDVTPPSPDGTVAGTARYDWLSRGRWQRLSVGFSGVAAIPDESSEEAFITEHYWGYARQRDGATVEYQVEHPRWAVWCATHATLDCDVGELYGARFSPYLRGEPSSAFVAQGSAVTVRRGTRV